MFKRSLVLLTLFSFILVSCEEDSTTQPITGKDPNTAQKVSVDRFSADAGNLMVRTPENGLPGANEPINYDQPPFITQGLAPDGRVVRYYNFDVQPTETAPIYVLFREGESSPVEGQLNIIDVIPGDAGYNDFWHVHKVTVPSGYVANTITSLQEINAEGFTIEPQPVIVNCPVVPEGSTANLRIGGGSNGLIRGWYKGMVVHYFSFEEKALAPANGMVPTSDIYVTFNINPNMQGGGPASGFVTESGTMQTHNVLETIPSNASYSPLWDVNVYDNKGFNSVMNISTAASANILARDVATVNCPVVFVGN